MPKGKRKGKSDRFTGSVQTSDDESAFDNASVFSATSEVRSTSGDEDVVDEVAQQEAFEEKLRDALDGLTQKSAQGRIGCAQAISKALQKKMLVEFVYDRRVTMCDSIERSLRKGSAEEKAVAAMLAPILCVQLGAGSASEEVCRDLKPILITSATDGSLAGSARAKCCTAMSLITFLAGGEMGEVMELMHIFESIFSASYIRGDQTVPNLTDDQYTLHAAALNAWTLLLTLMSPGDVYRMLNLVSKPQYMPTLDQIAGLLSSRHLDVRLAAGEALALVFELGRDYRNDFADYFISELVELMSDLANDSQKFRAKKDRKQQRATFRDILHFIEDDEQPDEQIRFGKEVLVLRTWTRRKQYDAVCTVLGSGLNLHLAENELLRDIFQLGERVYAGELNGTKQTKLERHLINSAAFKARTISRGKNRDKRSDF